jgi:hypothetical protein
VSGWRTVKGIVHVTLEVPFTVMVDEDAPSDPDALVDYFNNGAHPDAMEASQMEHADSRVHEVWSADVHAAHVVDDA